MKAPAPFIWPPDYLQEFGRRLKNKNRLWETPEKQKYYQVHYAANCIDWINDWCVTFNPRVKKPLPSLLPFMLFPRQIDFVHFILDCLNDKESGLVEKSRDMGATWLCCAISVWLWLYHPGTVIGWGSRTQDYVDHKDDPKAVFPKIRQIIQYLPSWMLPDGFNMKAHATYMRIINPQNMSAIIGEAGASMGRGGRTSIYFKDESAHYEHAEKVEAALGDNTDVQIDMSSVNGSANVFYRRRMSGEIWFPNKPPTPHKTRVFIFDWRDSPIKDQEWYDRRKQKAMDEGLLHIFAQEVDRDYAGSVDRVIIPAVWVRAALDAHIKLGIKDDGLKRAGQDVADGGNDKNALCAAHGVILRYADHWGGDAGDAAKRAIPTCVELGVKELYYDSVGVGTGFKTEINTMKESPGWPKIAVAPWNGGAEVLDGDDPIIPGDDESPTNRDQYSNLKAQSWWRLRARFYKTYRAVTFGAIYPHEDLISLDSTIPVIHQLMMELSQAVHKYDKKGKTMVDKKPDGALSPNLADALVICYSPTRELSIFDVL